LIAFEGVPPVCLSCHATTAFKVPLRVKMMTMRSLKRVVALPDIKVETEDIRTRSKRKMMSLSMAMFGLSDEGSTTDGHDKSQAVVGD
jgi:hypothetical protein